jgi:hypothetical protein
MLKSMIPDTVRLAIDWMHIREAERRGRRVTPVELALVEQSRFARLDVTNGALVLIDAQTGEPVGYAPCPELAAFLERFNAGAPTAPARFTLRRAAA